MQTGFGAPGNRTSRFKNNKTYDQNKKKNKKIKWHILFNDKNFKYNLNSRNLNNITAYNLAEIIYPDITKHKFKKIINFLHKNITLKKKNKLLDFGSGNRAFLFFFQKKVSKL